MSTSKPRGATVGQVAAPRATLGEPLNSCMVRGLRERSLIAIPTQPISSGLIEDTGASWPLYFDAATAKPVVGRHSRLPQADQPLQGDGGMAR